MNDGIISTGIANGALTIEVRGWFRYHLLRWLFKDSTKFAVRRLSNEA